MKVLTAINNKWYGIRASFAHGMIVAYLEEILGTDDMVLSMNDPATHVEYVCCWDAMYHNLMNKVIEKGVVRTYIGILRSLSDRIIKGTVYDPSWI